MPQVVTAPNVGMRMKVTSCSVTTEASPGVSIGPVLARL